MKVEDSEVLLEENMMITLGAAEHPNSLDHCVRLLQGHRGRFRSADHPHTGNLEICSAKSQKVDIFCVFIGGICTKASNGSMVETADEIYIGNDVRQWWG